MAREMLGAIPSLVAMLDDSGGGKELLAAALYALLNLGTGNDANKAAIVQAGVVLKMLRIAEGASGALTEALVTKLLCLIALDVNKPIIAASWAALFLVRVFEAAATELVRHDALRALLNMSIAAANAPHLLAAGLTPSLLAAVGDTAASDRALAALYNIVAACPEGRRSGGLGRSGPSTSGGVEARCGADRALAAGPRRAWSWTGRSWRKRSKR
ncbi:hypothetical protein ACQ4PT_046389 [Festuca glaucescens]